MNRRKSCRESYRENKFRKNFTRKRKIPSKWTAEDETATTENTTMKLKRLDDIFVPEDDSVNYRILNFNSVFAEISQLVKCKECGGNVRFQTASTRGLGFNILVLCEDCQPTEIVSCPKIGSAYEINRRFAFTMRCLGHGPNGEVKFCGLMDFPPPVAQGTHHKMQKNMYTASKTVAQLSMKNAVEEEQLRTSVEKEEENVTELTVSGDGTWQKRGFSSLFGVSSLIGMHSKKIIDVNIKSSYCKQCEVWAKKKGSEEYEEWKKEHENNCLLNHQGSAGKMEVDAVVEMFEKSEEQYNVKYTDYIGDGDSKTSLRRPLRPR